MAIQATITKIGKAANGRIYVRIGKTEYEFGSLAEVTDFAKQRLTQDVLHAIMIAIIMERAPTLGAAGIAALEGKGVKIDLSANNWGTVI